MNTSYNKKIFTPGLLITDLGFLVFRIPRIIAAMRNKAIDAKFRKKIMLVVTAVNGCTYCAWFHAKKALSDGLNDTEIRQLLNLQFKANASDFELPGLLYAQHYAETDRKPDSGMTERFREFYGEKTAGQLFLFIRIIFFGNLSGNTYDAFLSRRNGKKAQNSSFLFEFIFYLFSAPVLAPLRPFVKRMERLQTVESGPQTTAGRRRKTESGRRMPHRKSDRKETKQ